MSYTQGTWNTAEQIREHKLATSIINLHGTPDAVFDDTCLEELKHFTMSRSVNARDAFLQDLNTNDNPDAKHKSLTGYIIGRYGTDNEALDERDWELLEEWFRKGMPAGEDVVR